VKLAPAVAPVARHLDGMDRGKRGSQPLLAVGVGVHRKFQCVRLLDLLEAVREQRQQLRAALLRAVERNDD